MTETDVVLIGAGIMSATLGTLLRLVEPDWSITLIERLDGVAKESSGPVAQRRYGSLRAVRAELHTGVGGRFDRHHQGGVRQ